MPGHVQFTRCKEYHNKMVVSREKNLFETGEGYRVLSRVTSLNDLGILVLIPEKLKADPIQ